MHPAYPTIPFSVAASRNGVVCIYGRLGNNPTVPPLLRSKAPIFNLSLGGSTFGELKFRWSFPELIVHTGQEIGFEILNDEGCFQAESQLEAYHSQQQKQSFGYNPYAAAHTAWLTATYPDHTRDFNYTIVENVLFFLHHFFSMCLSFLQRRRVVIGTLRLIPSQWVISMPPFLAAELVDAPAFGSTQISNPDLSEAVAIAIRTYSASSPDQRVLLETLLLRYNNVLNLPYAYERAEALWRVIEELGRRAPKGKESCSEYERLRGLIGIKKQSQNLRNFVSALRHYDIKYDDEQLRIAFNYRNAVIHEYLNREVFSGSDASVSYGFLLFCVEEAIFEILGLDRAKRLPSSHSIIEGRII